MAIHQTQADFILMGRVRYVLAIRHDVSTGDWGGNQISTDATQEVNSNPAHLSFHQSAS